MTTTWMADALCREIDPDLWFPEKGDPARVAKKMCRSCPVFFACTSHSLVADERHGIWGGLAESDRRAILRAPARNQPNNDHEVAA